MMDLAPVAYALVMLAFFLILMRARRVAIIKKNPRVPYWLTPEGQAHLEDIEHREQA